MPLEWWPQGGGSALGRGSGLTCLALCDLGQIPSPWHLLCVVGELRGVGHILSVVPSSLELLGS